MENLYVEWHLWGIPIWLDRALALRLPRHWIFVHFYIHHITTTYISFLLLFVCLRVRTQITFPLKYCIVKMPCYEALYSSQCVTYLRIDAWIIKILFIDLFESTPFTSQLSIGALRRALVIRPSPLPPVCSDHSRCDCACLHIVTVLGLTCRPMGFLVQSRYTYAISWGLCSGERHFRLIISCTAVAASISSTISHHGQTDILSIEFHLIVPND